MMFRALPYALLCLLLLQGCSTYDGTMSPRAKPQASENLLDRVAIAPPPVAKMPAPQLPKPAVAAPRRALLLLPLSGPHAAVGNQLLQAAQLAVQDLAPDSFTVAPVDTAGGAAAALQGALRQRADIIIGPLFSVDVATTKAIAMAENIPMLALSNDETQADRNTFLMGASPAAQVQRVVGYASRNGVRNVVALVPNNAYGNAIVLALQSVPVSVAKVVTYDAAQPNMAGITQQLAALKYDAVLLPEGGERGVQIAAALRNAGLLQTARLLGSSQWDDRGDDVASNPAFNGGWYATLDKDALAGFAQRYNAAFGAPPPPTASFAYDATALAALLAANGWGYDINTLTQDQGFAGMAGAFRLRVGGEVQRALAVHEITSSGYKTLDAAPARLQ